MTTLLTEVAETSHCPCSCSEGEMVTKDFATVLLAWHLVLSVAMHGSARTLVSSGWMHMLISTPLLQLSLETSMDSLSHFS